MFLVNGMAKNKLKYFLGLLSLIIVGYCFISQVRAALPGEGLTISPPILEIELNPGESKTNIIRISNPTSSIVQAYPKVMDFKAKGETGEPAFIEQDERNSSYSLAKWITFEETKIALAPEQVKEFRYTISVPSNAEPGGHYGAVFFVSEPPEKESQSSQVSLSTMIGSLVLVKVPGNIIEKATIEDFYPDKKIYILPPANIVTRIVNLGNVHIKPRGSLEIKGWFGAPKEKLVFNETGGNVLPDSARKFENKWSFGKLAFGLFNLKLEVVYGESEKALIKSASFWIIPWWLIIILVILTLLFLFKFLKNKFRKRTKKVSQKETNTPLIR